MVALPGGTFLMGTDFAEGFPADGEGSGARRYRATLLDRPLDPSPTACFSEFVEATGYRTEAERFGWSFVFWLHIPPRAVP